MAKQTLRKFVALAVATSSLAAMVLAACSSSKSGAQADAGEDADVCPPGQFLFDAAALDDAQIQLGKSLVMTLEAGVPGTQGQTCTSCHGQGLIGNLTGFANGAQMDEGGVSFPPNLTPDPATGLGCWTIDQIVRAIMEGMDNQGQYICPPMPRWGQYGLTDAGAHAIAQYLLSLPPYVQQVPNTACVTPAGWPDAAEPGPDAAQPHKDGGGDATMGDASQGDAADGTAETGPSEDASEDAGSDGAADATTDAAADAATDAAGDSAPLDAGVDAADAGADAGGADASDAAGDDAGATDAGDASSNG